MTPTETITLPPSQSLATSIRARALVFNDPLSLVLLSRIERCAPGNACILVIGEPGTGKELVGRQIHRLSPRRDGPFIVVNASDLNDLHGDQALFGLESMNASGRIDTRAGWLEAAQGGTLYLDDVGDLPLNTQGKLLHALKSRSFARDGGNRVIPLNVRIIAASSIPLEGAVNAGHFLAELFALLRSETLCVLPLGQRPGDILPLAYHFLAEYRTRLRYPPVELSPGARERLLSHSWPGNIRELENAIHHALLVCQKQVIRAADLPIAGHITAMRDCTSGISEASTPFGALERALATLFDQNIPQLHDRLEDLIVHAAFKHCHHNQMQTAKLLGISRNVVRARLSRLGLVANKPS